MTITKTVITNNFSNHAKKCILKRNIIIVKVNGHEYCIEQYFKIGKRPSTYLTGEHTHYGRYPGFKKALKTIFEIEKGNEPAGTMHNIIIA